MKKVKKILIPVALVVLVLGVILGYRYTKNWPARYSALLDSFFGAGNWECSTQETKESHLLEKTIYENEDIHASKTISGSYRNWYITYETEDHTQHQGKITNHAYLLNHDSYGIFSGKRYSQKQALTLELMDLSFEMIGEEVLSLFTQHLLSQEEADCLSITMSYQGGNPSPKFYDDLQKQDWFNIQDISAQHYLSYDQHDFYLFIRADDQKVEKLSPDLQTHLHNSRDAMVNLLLETYGADASFELYLGNDQRAICHHGTLES